MIFCGRLHHAKVEHELSKGPITFAKANNIANLLLV